MDKGIHKGLSNEQYHAEKDHLSSSNFKDILKDITRFHKQKILKEEVPSKKSNAMDEGTYAHSLLLEPHLIDKEFVFFNGMRRAGKDWEAFKNSHANDSRIILTKPQKLRVEAWANAYKKFVKKTGIDWITPSDIEFSLFGEYKGIPAKVRADVINIEEGYIADVKTSAYPIDADSWGYTMDDFGYKLSAALYVDMFSEYYGKQFEFRFIILGKKCIGTELFTMGEKSLNEGRQQLLKAVKKYKECKKTGIWTPETKKIKTYSKNYEVLEV